MTSIVFRYFYAQSYDVVVRTFPCKSLTPTPPNCGRHLWMTTCHCQTYRFVLFHQELLEWLLDGLHEDLNRVTEKPYSELKDSDGRPDSVVAHEAWAQHHARNQSIVIDLFYGQLKSKVSCLGCGRDSVRFDPFSLLSLPLPVENFTYCEVLGKKFSFFLLFVEQVDFH